MYTNWVSVSSIYTCDSEPHSTYIFSEAYNDLNGIEKCIKKLVETGSDFLYAKANIIDEDYKNLFKNHKTLKNNKIQQK